MTLPKGFGSRGSDEDCPKCGKTYNSFKYRECPYCIKSGEVTIPFTKKGFGLFIFRVSLLSMIGLIVYMMTMVPFPEKALVIIPGLLLVIIIAVGIDISCKSWYGNPSCSRKELFGFNFGARWKKD